MAEGGPWERGFVLQLAISATTITSIQMLKPMVTYRAIDLGATPLEIGLVVSAFSVVPALTALAIGRLVDRRGEVHFLTLAFALLAIASGMAAIVGSLALLALCQVVMGTGQIFYLVAGQSLMANNGPQDGREYRFGWYATVASLAQLIGPVLGAYLVSATVDSRSILSGAVTAGTNRQALVFVVATFLGLVALVLSTQLRSSQRARTVDTEVAQPQGVAGATARVLRRPSMAAAMFVSITVISSIDVLVAYLPAYASANGLSVETVGFLLSVRAGASLVSRVFMVRLVGLLGRRSLLALSTGLAGGGLLLLPWAPDLPALYGLMVLIGLGLGFGQPLTIAWVANRSHREERALALAVRLTGNRAALLAAPALMGALAGVTSLAAIWVVMGVFLVGGATVAARTQFNDQTARHRELPGS